MSLSEILATLRPELGLSEQTSGANGICKITIDGQLQVVLEMSPQEDSLYLYSVVASVDEINAASLYATVLEAQLFGREIGEGMAFGLDRATSEIILCRKLPGAGLEPDVFSGALTEFINWAEHWQARLSTEGMNGHGLNEPSIPTESFIRA